MAISVNEVYTTVLTIINKEQRGYITPYEFNQLATQVQLEILESYFENLNQQLRIGGNSSEYANRVKLLQEKISTFEVEDVITVNNLGVSTLPNELHRLGALRYINYDYLPVEIEETTRQEFNLLRRSSLTSPTSEWPMYYIIGNEVKILPATATDLNNVYTIEYIRKPKNVVWAYQVGTLGEYIYEPTIPPPVGTIPSTGAQDFEISDVDQTEVILKILAYAGVIIRDPQIIQAASAAVQQQDQLEAS
jgi:hypothetical protein